MSYVIAQSDGMITTGAMVIAGAIGLLILVLWVAVPFILMDIRREARRANDQLDDLLSEIRAIGQNTKSGYELMYKQELAKRAAAAGMKKNAGE